MAVDPVPQPMPQNIKLIEAPTIYATISQVTLANNDFIITLARFQPAVADNIPAGSAAMLSVPQAVVMCSPGSMKDMYLAMGDQIRQYEEKFGEIETDYTRSLKAAKK